MQYPALTYGGVGAVCTSIVVHAHMHVDTQCPTLPCVHDRASTFTGVRTALCVVASKDWGEIRFKRSALAPLTVWLPLSPLSCSHTVPGTQNRRLAVSVATSSHAYYYT